MSDLNQDHQSNANNAAASRLRLAVILTLAFVITEAVLGYFAHSLALMSDAGHNFADAAALAFSWYAIWMSRKPSHQGMTFGYHRVGILAALINAVSLVGIALVIFWEAIERFHSPGEVQGWLMIVVATVAIIINLVISKWLHSASKNDLNVRSAYLHMLGDAVSAFGVVIAGVIVVLFGTGIADPIVSILIAGLVLWSSWSVLAESVNVLLEGTPFGLDMSKVEKCVSSVAGVIDAHDLHVWTVGPGAIACSCHILVAEQSIREGNQILKHVAAALEHDFSINHATIQIEVDGHDKNDMYCCIEPSAEISHAGHNH